MQLKTQYEFLFVGRDEGSFLENYAYKISEGDSGSSQVFVCLEIQNNPAEAEMIGERIFETFKKSFFADKTAKDPYIRFENSLKDMNRVIDGFREGKSSGHIGRLHMIAAALSGDNMYLSQTGDSEAYLIRKHFVSSVTEGLYDPQSKELFTSIANGNLEPGDFVLFSSTRLLRYISKSNLTRLVQPDVTRTLSDLREIVSPEILGKIGFIGISVGLPVVKDDVFEEREPVSVGVYFEKISSLFSRASVVVKKIPFSRMIKMPKSETLRHVSNRLKESLSFDGIQSLEAKKKLVGVFAGAVLILILGTWFMSYQSSHNAEILAFDAKLAEARQQVSEAETKGQYDKEAASVIFANAEAKAKEVIGSSSHRAKASEVLALIAKTRDVLDDIRRLSEARMLIDVSASDSSADLRGFVSLNNRFFAYSSNHVYEILIDKIQNSFPIDVGSDSIISATAFEEMSSVLLYTKSGKIFELKNGSVRQMATLDGAFRKGVAIQDWGSRLYVLDPDSDQIWRYSYIKSRDVFGTAEGYKVDGSLKDAVDIAIDGSVYTLEKKDGKLVRYYGGSQQNFKVANAPFTPPESAYRLYTDGDLSFMFVLDVASSKIYVYSKDPTSSDFTYRYQLLFDGLKDLRDIYFAQTTNQIYVMDSKKIYEVSL
ncbi:MAG: hypothetical protein AAB551_00715 [Patescibacteria group bacterium]